MNANFTIAFRHLILFVSLTSPFFVSSQPVVAYDNFITSGLNTPIDMVNAGDGSGRLFIAEKGGAIKVWQSGSAVLSTPFLTVPSLAPGDEQGLLSLAFHPDYENNGFFYVYYTRSPDGALVIDRYQNPTPSDNIAEGGKTELLVIPHPGQSNHNGGHLHFRIEGGINYLYIATGDGGGANDPNNNAQNMGSYLGKMLRINVDQSLPVTPEIYAIGLRNPFRWSFDKSNGDIWIGDVGQGLKEEVDFLAAGTSAGANFGWRCFEGTVQNTSFSPTCNPANDIAPVFEYNNAVPSAITGGYVYRGSNSVFQGYYITSDFFSGKLWILNSDGTVARTQTNLAANIAAYGEDEDGELYAVSLTANRVYHVAASAGSPLPLTLINFSAKKMAGYTEVKWTTSFEQNSDKYIIEYSTDGSNYITAGDVLAANNPSGYSYTYRHINNLTDRLFYRLKMIDIDGSFKYSPVVIVNSSGKNDIRIYPTILKNGTLELNTTLPLYKLNLFNSDGAEILTKSFNGLQGYISVQLPNMAKGIYIVRLAGKDFEKTEKVVVQ